jgi:sec-independent protein translocase protein TatC
MIDQVVSADLQSLLAGSSVRTRLAAQDPESPEVSRPTKSAGYGSHMKQKYDDDLFKDTTMTFGEHLDELRVALFKAVLGLMVGCIVGFFLADYTVALILRPLEGALGTYYANASVEAYDAWANKLADAKLPNPYTKEQINQLVFNDHMLFDIMYVDPRQALDEVLRSKPQWPKTLSQAAANANREPAPITEPEASPNIMQRLAPILLFHPAKEDERIQAKSFSFPETFGIWLKASLVVGMIISSPWVFYQIWSFVAAGLYPHEKKYIHVFLPFSLALFLLGAATAYLLVFQPVLNFLLTFNKSLGIGTDPRISEWLGFVLLLPLGFGIGFQLPLVMLFLERIGIFGIRAYIEKWRIAVLVIFIISAVLTPADPYSILFMAVPLVLLYFGGILLCRFLPNRRAEAA